MSVVIETVNGKKELKEFIQFGIHHYEGNTCYVPPLISDEMNTFDKDKNPVFEFCEVVHYMAYRDGEPVGRIAGIINHRSNEKFNQKQARFGWIEFNNDLEVSGALLQAVEKWAKQKGMNEIIGPMGFTDLDYEGCLVEGFDQPGTSSTIYNYPYYEHHFLSHGYVKDADWVEYKIYIPDAIPEKHIRIGELVKKKYNLKVVKPSSRKRLVKEYGAQIFDVMNQAYASLYGYCELTKRQIDYYINLYLPLVRLDCVRVIIDENKKVVGFGIAVPSLTEAMQKAKGKLWPWGWYHILKALRGNNKVIDLYLVAVHPDYQSKGVNALLFTELIPQFIANGYLYAESNPELESNEKVQGQWEYFEREQHKRRRAFCKKI